MQIIKNDKLLFCDVDSTLIDWDRPGDPNAIGFKLDDTVIDLVPIWSTVDKLRHFKSENYTVVIWSQTGYEWCVEVVNKLRINHLVDVCMSKPTKFIDDLPAFVFMDEKDRIKP